MKFVVTFCLFFSLQSRAQVVIAPTQESKIPYDLQGVGIDEKTGSKIDLNLGFTDENGQKVELKKYFNSSKPVIVAIVYYACPNLCSIVLNSTIDSLKDLKLKAGNDFEVVAISFDPRETPKLALAKKATYMKYLLGHSHGLTKDPEQGLVQDSTSANQYLNSPQANGWHFLVGNEISTKAITNQLGFHYKWDKEILQFAHASAIYILTPEGQVSRQFYGIMYPPLDLKLSLVEAAKGKIGTLMDHLLLFCYHYDAGAKKYVVMAQKIMSIGGMVTLAILAIFMAIFWKKELTISKK